jgi:uncharacterized protein YlzI (FlbEa/FlbD family)
MSFVIYNNGEHFFSADHCPESIEGVPDIYMSIINSTCKQLEAADPTVMSMMQLTHRDDDIFYLIVSVIPILNVIALLVCMICLASKFGLIDKFLWVIFATAKRIFKFLKFVK